MHPTFHAGIVYNPLQQKTKEYVGQDINIVVKAPTSSGKTITAEQFIFSKIEEGYKAIYLSPLKALTEEKKKAWVEQPYSILTVTSDYAQPQAFTQDLILMTTEALDSKTRGRKTWLSKVGTLVVDEAHLLGSLGRGDALETGLMRFTQINPEAQIIFLSATIPNASSMAEWLTRMNSKHTEVIDTDWRPVILNHNLVISENEEWNLNKKVQHTVYSLAKEFPNKQVLIFVHSIGKGHTLSKALECPFHYSKLTKDKKASLELAFEEKKIQRMVSTSTLAWGRNLPADIVVVVGAERGPTEVDPLDIQQMAGRAGRFGMSEEGHVYYIFKQHHAKEYYEKVTNIPPVDSVLDSRLHFHLVSFIYREKMDLPTIREFLSRSFYGEIDIEKHLTPMEELGIIERDGDFLSVDRIGRAAALMYIDPYDLYSLKLNLEERPTTPYKLAIAFANIPSYAYPCFIPKDIETQAIQMPYAQQTIVATSLHQWLKGETLSPTAAVTIPPLVNDIERWTSGLGIAGLSTSYINAIKHMLLNGVDENLAPLVEIEGIGRARASKLYTAGIRSPEDIPKNPKIAKGIITEKVYNRFMDKLDGKVTLRF